MNIIDCSILLSKSQTSNLKHIVEWVDICVSEAATRVYQMLIFQPWQNTIDCTIKDRFVARMFQVQYCFLSGERTVCRMRKLEWQFDVRNSPDVGFMRAHSIISIAGRLTVVNRMALRRN